MEMVQEEATFEGKKTIKQTEIEASFNMWCSSEKLSCQ